MLWLLSMLVLHPVLDEPADLRIVASGVGEADVVWELDGRPIAVTGDREATTIHVDGGRHELVARSTAEGAWEILARSEPAPRSGAMYVPAWTARHVPATPVDSAVPEWLWAVPVLMVAAGVGIGGRLRAGAKQP